VHESAKIDNILVDRSFIYSMMSQNQHTYMGPSMKKKKQKIATRDVTKVRE